MDKWIWPLLMSCIGCTFFLIVILTILQVVSDKPRKNWSAAAAVNVNEYLNSFSRLPYSGDRHHELGAGNIQVENVAMGLPTVSMLWSLRSTIRRVAYEWRPGETPAFTRSRPEEIFPVLHMDREAFRQHVIGECKLHDVIVGNDVRKSQGKPMCDCFPSELHGTLPQTNDVLDFARLEAKFPEVREGFWESPGCTSHYRVAIVIPYRNRDRHLRLFLHHMIPILERQKVAFAIYVIEQLDNVEFNRAMLLNVGFAEAQLDGRGFQCYIFHDVDLFPEDDYNLYNCPLQPRHMSASLRHLLYRLQYLGIFGGASALRTEHFKEINGYSNCYFGWGGEDDDMSIRVRHRNFQITRFPEYIARYRSARHRSEPINDERFDYLKDVSKRMPFDGLNSLSYTTKAKVHKRLYTLVSVSLNKNVIKKLCGRYLSHNISEVTNH